MFRKPVIKTYGRGRGREVKTCQPQNWPGMKSRLWNDSKTSTESDSDPLETTFDKLAKDVRLPLPPLLEVSNSLLDSSSDVSFRRTAHDNLKVYKGYTSPVTNKRKKRITRAANKEIIVKRRRVTGKKAPAKLPKSLLNTSEESPVKDSIKRSQISKSKIKKEKNVHGKLKKQPARQRRRISSSDSSQGSQYIEIKPGSSKNKLTHEDRQNIDPNDQCKSQTEPVIANCTVSIINNTDEANFMTESKNFAGSNGVCTSTDDKENRAVGLPGSENDDQQVSIKLHTELTSNLKDKLSHLNKNRSETNNRNKARAKLVRHDDTQVDESFVNNTKDNSSANHQIKPCYIALTKNCKNTPRRTQWKDESKIPNKSYNYNSCEDIFCSHASDLMPNDKSGSFQVDDNQSNNHDEHDKYPDLKLCSVNVKRHTMMDVPDHTSRLNSGAMLCSTPLHKYTAIDESMQRISPVIRSTKEFMMKSTVSVEELEVSTKYSTNNEKLTSHFDPKYSRAMGKYSPTSRKKQLNSLNGRDVENVQRDAVQSGIIEDSLNSIKVESGRKSNELLLVDTQTSNSYQSDSSKIQIVHDSLCNDFSNSMLVQSSRKLDTATNKSKYTGLQPTPAGIITTRTGRQLDLSLATEKRYLRRLMNVEVRLETLTIDGIKKLTSCHKSAKTPRNTTEFTKSRRKVDTSISDDETSMEMRARSRSNCDITSKNISSIKLADDNIPKHQHPKDSKMYNLADTELCNSRSSSSNVVSKHSIASEPDIIDEPNLTTSWVSCDEKDNIADALSQQDIPENAVFSSNKLHSLNENHTANQSGLSYKSTENDSDWSTLSDNASENHDADGTYSDVLEKPRMIEDVIGNCSVAYSRLSDSDCSIKSWKSTEDQSADSSNVLRRRTNLYAKINTRNRRNRCTSLKSQTHTPVKKDGRSASDKSPNEILVSTSDIEEMEASENIEDSFAISNELVENCLVENDKQNLQPIVLLRKLRSPPRVAANQPATNDLQLNEPRETLDASSKTLETTSSELSNSSSIPLNIHENTQVQSKDHELEPVVILHKFKCPPTVTTCRRVAWKSNLSLMNEDRISDTVSMNIPDEISSNKDEVVEKLENSANIIVENSPIRSSQADTLSIGTENGSLIDEDDVGELKFSKHSSLGRQSVFLKPGKQYSRSLSILNSIHQGMNLEASQPSKGKNWRLSVQAVIEMQKGVIQSCLKANEDDKTTQTHCEPLGRPSIIHSRISSSKLRSFRSASPSKFTRRTSVRVILDNKKPDCIEDTSFLEAYGISTGKNNSNLSRRSTIKPPRTTLPRDVVCNNLGNDKIDTRQIETARDVVLQRCSQEDYLLFEECFTEEYLEHCKKIGEGVYGEVFLYDNGEDKSVVKIIPIEGSLTVNGEIQKRFHEILSEIVIAKELHDLRYNQDHRTDGFVKVKSIKCIIGKYPDSLIELWQCYDNEKGSDNDCPSVFDENQLYIVLELSHGGEDLEAFVFDTAVQAHALFVQTALALAVAEQALEFEHRDLHWGNVLITKTDEREVCYKLGNKEYSYPTKGVKVAIIDFTLSRMSYDGCCIFNDLELDPALFAAQGEYQFEVYRLMREKVGHNWQNFEPYTNILWLHYTLDKMITALRYRRKSVKRHKDAIIQLQELKDVLLDYESAFDFVSNCKKITQLQVDARRD